MRTPPCRCRWVGVYTVAIQLDTGTFQGSVFSPFLFDLFINTLLLLLDSSRTSHKAKNPPDWNHQAFADDLSLYMEDTADADTLLKLVQKFQDWSGLKISTKNRLPREPCMAARPEEAKQWPMLRLAGKRLALCGPIWKDAISSTTARDK